MKRRIKKFSLLILAAFYVIMLTSCGFAANFNKLKNEVEKSYETEAPIEETTEEPTERPTERPTEKPHKDENEAQRKYNEFLLRAEGIEDYEASVAETAMDQSTMNRESYYIYTQWDKLLNDIYNYLKTKMDKGDFAALEADEIAWIKEKEAAIEEAGNDYAGGSIEPLMRNSTASAYTSERCYYLMSFIK